MPRKRIPLDYTNERKLLVANEWLDLVEVDDCANRSAYAREVGISRQTLHTWERKRDHLVAACENGRAKALTVGGSGRVSDTSSIEDDIVIWIKEQRREEHPDSRETIILKAVQLLHSFFEHKTMEARFAWCDRFMDRHNLTIRIITRSGRKDKAQLGKLKDDFANEVCTILITHFIDSESFVPPPFFLFNMDQTAVYCNLGAKTTVEFVGAKRVPCNVAGKGGYRCTFALTISADGRMYPPHFVFKGESECEVHAEVRGFCDPSVATMSVQTNTWFSEDVMLEWIHDFWRFQVTGPTVLILDSLRIHKIESVQNALADLGTFPLYVPGGTTSVVQPLDVGVMGPFKRHLRELYVSRYTGRTSPSTASERRRDMFERTLLAMESIQPQTIKNSFFKAGPFFPFGPELAQEHNATEAIV